MCPGPISLNWCLVSFHSPLTFLSCSLIRTDRFRLHLVLTNARLSLPLRSVYATAELSAFMWIWDTRARSIDGDTPDHERLCVYTPSRSSTSAPRVDSTAADGDGACSCS